LEDIYGMLTSAENRLTPEEISRTTSFPIKFQDYLIRVCKGNNKEKAEKAEKARIILADIYFDDPKYCKSGGRNKRSLNRKSGSRLTLKKRRRRRRRIMTSTACRNRGK
jgi:hypothetical protein